MLEKLEDQIERLAPNFRDCILARRVFSPGDRESMDPIRWAATLEAGQWISASSCFDRHGSITPHRHKIYTSVRSPSHQVVEFTQCAATMRPNWRWREQAANRNRWTIVPALLSAIPSYWCSKGERDRELSISQQHHEESAMCTARKWPKCERKTGTAPVSRNRQADSRVAPVTSPQVWAGDAPPALNRRVAA
jgi:hypothetical protein